MTLGQGMVLAFAVGAAIGVALVLVLDWYARRIDNSDSK